MTDVVRVRNPAAFEIEEIEALFRRALETNSLVRDIDTAMAELQRGVTGETAGVFMAGDSQNWQAVAISQLGQSSFAPVCSVLHLYNEGPSKLVDALIRELVDFAKSAGYDTIMGIDMSDRPQAFARRFIPLSGPVQFVGYTCQFKIEDR